MFIRLIAAISRINLSDFYQCFGLKGLALWLSSFVVGCAIIESIWPQGLMAWIILLTILFYFTAKVRYNRSQGPLNSEQIWELEKAAREHAESKGFEEARAIVPKHVEISEPNPSKKRDAQKSE
ncbi:MAG: hypothetical protein QF600_00510 [Verrucomicrobiota bacterium]|jgi:hypothetical protein|nr:hypothetical protein [Verrucomicrobiota bacterium]